MDTTAPNAADAQVASPTETTSASGPGTAASRRVFLGALTVGAAAILPGCATPAEPTKPVPPPPVPADDLVAVQVTYFLPRSAVYGAQPLTGMPPGVHHPSDGSPTIRNPADTFYINFAHPGSHALYEEKLELRVARDTHRVAQATYVKSLWEGRFAGTTEKLR